MWKFFEIFFDKRLNTNTAAILLLAYFTWQTHQEIQQLTEHVQMLKDAIQYGLHLQVNDFTPEKKSNE